MIVSEALNEKERKTLNSILNQMIPPSHDGRMPGAADVGFFDYMEKGNLTPWIREGLASVHRESSNAYDKEFCSLSRSDQAQLIEKLRRKMFHFFNRLSVQVFQCYYQHDRVLEAIGLEARPPFPQGYKVEEGDLTLLGSVYERGKIYRD